MDRYHLYVSYTCPWAHRTLVFRALKGLEQVIPVPVLWDKRRQTIVNNESSEIIRMLNSEFDEFGNVDVDFYPEALREQIDAINQPIYDYINNGVYRAGFARTLAAYNAAYDQLFKTMDELETRLTKQRYLVGEQITEADWRLFTTLVRFDAVYYCHFKTNQKRLVEYPALWACTRELYQIPGVAETVNMDHIKYHYFASHLSINPIGLVPQGPDIDLTQPHWRESTGQGFHSDKS